MARGVNKAILIGHLGQDPEVRYSANGTAIANCSLATTESWKDKQSGDKVEKTEWHRIVFFTRLAEIVGEYLKKGSQIYVEGRLQTRKWQDKEGHDRYTTEIVVSDMQMLGSRQGAGAPPSGMDDYAPASNSSSNNQGSKPAAANAPSAYDEFDDDIPF